MGVGCSAHQGAARPPEPAEPPRAPMAPGFNASAKLRVGSALLSRQDFIRGRAVALMQDTVFWKSEAFTDIAASGRPPKDAQVLQLLVNDAVDPRMRAASIKVYLEAAVEEWGPELFSIAQALPAIAAVFGLMMSCCGTIATRQVNRHNCKLLLECIRSAALVLGAAFRAQRPEDIRQREAQLKPLLLECMKVLLSARVLLSNYSHPSSWVLLLHLAKQDKELFEGLHACMEHCTSSILALLLPAPVAPWCAPAADYNNAMERLATKLLELSQQRALSHSIRWAASQAPEQLAPLAHMTGVDPAELHAALADKAGAAADNSRLAGPLRSVELLPGDRQKLVERAQASQAKFDAIHAAQQAPRMHSSRKLLGPGGSAELVNPAEQPSSQQGGIPAVKAPAPLVLPPIPASPSGMPLGTAGSMTAAAGSMSSMPQATLSPAADMPGQVASPGAEASPKKKKKKKKKKPAAAAPATAAAVPPAAVEEPGSDSG